MFEFNLFNLAKIKKKNRENNITLKTTEQRN